MIVYKILLEKEFSTLKNQKVSYGSAVDKKDGFIHLSTANQLKETLEIGPRGTYRIDIGSRSSKIPRKTKKDQKFQQE